MALIKEMYRQITGRDAVYNLQPIDNLPSVLTNGILSHQLAAEYPHRSVALEDVQDRREQKTLPNGYPLHAYANMYFDSWNPMLSRIRDKNEYICITSIDASVLDIPGCVITTGNAATSWTVFYRASEIWRIDFDAVFQTYWTDRYEGYDYEQLKTIKCAEILVPNKVPSSLIRGFTVYNDKAKSRLINMGIAAEFILVDSGAFF